VCCRLLRVSPIASSPARQSPRVRPRASAVSRLPRQRAYVIHIPAQHAPPLSYAACAIRPFDHPCNQLSDVASGSAVRPMKVKICAIPQASERAQISQILSNPAVRARAAPLDSRICLAVHLRAQRAINCLAQPFPSSSASKHLSQPPAIFERDPLPSRLPPARTMSRSALR
jgi:hypothetical protein